MGLEAIYPKRRTTHPGEGHKIYPCLRRNLETLRPDQVCSTDVTDVPLERGFPYLVAVTDWLSRTYWRGDCRTRWKEAPASRPWRKHSAWIFNSDQGCQFTAALFVSRLESRRIAVSRDGRGRALDNVFIERLWRSVKYEKGFLRAYADGSVVSGIRGARRPGGGREDAAVFESGEIVR